MKLKIDRRWRITKLTMDDLRLIDRFDEPDAQRASVLMIVKRNEEPHMRLHFGKADAGTTPTAAFGPGKLAEALARAITDEITSLTTVQNDGEDLDIPDEVVAAAVRTALRRVGMKVTDMSADGPASVNVAPGYGTPTNKRASRLMAPQVKRAIAETLERERKAEISGWSDSKLVCDLTKSRSSTSGMSDALLRPAPRNDIIVKRSETADQPSDHISDIDELALRLSKRQERQSLGFSAVYGGNARPFRGSSSPGCYGDVDGFGKVIERISKLHKDDVGAEFEKLLH